MWHDHPLLAQIVHISEYSSIFPPTMFILRQISYFYQMGFFRRCILACILAVWTVSSGAQFLHLPYRHYTVHDGLAQQQVMSLLQDSRGYIWAGTKVGLSKFNGQHFENFRPAQGLPGSYIASLKEDGLGRVWASSYSGVGYYDGVEWHKVSDEAEAELIRGAEKGEMLFFCYKAHTLWRFSGDTLVLADSITPQQVNQYLQQPVAPGPGQWVLYAQGGQSSTLIKVNAAGRMLGAAVASWEDYFRSSPNREGGYYLASKPDESGMVYLSRPGEGQPVDSIRFSREMANLGANRLLFVFGPHGSIYFVLDNNQLFFKPPKGLTPQKLEIPISNISGLMAGREGAIWIHGEDGLYQYFPQGFKYISSQDVPTPWGFFQDESGDYWISSLGYGLKRVRQGALSTYPSPQDCPAPDKFYYGISEDHLGNLYFSHERGLVCLRNGRFDWILRRNPLPPAEDTPVLYNYFDAQGGKVLAGLKGGVALFDPESGQLEPLLLEAISGAYVLGITRDDNDNYWFTSGRRGIVRYHIPTGKIHSFHLGENGVPLDGAGSVQNDPGHGLWFGSSEGLFYYSNQAQQFRKVAEGIVAGRVSNLQVVDSFLMIGSISGLHVLHLPTFHKEGKEWLKAYNQNNGFLGIEPDQNGAYLDRQGNYWVICFNQIARIPREDITMEDYPSRVRIFQINGQRAPYTTSASIVLPEGENQITVRFESIGFQRPLRTQYSWRLLGHTSAWSGWTEDQIAFFPQLPSGEYDFEVRSRHPGSLDSTDHITDAYSFQVEQAFYKEPNFYQLAFSAGLALIVLSCIGFGFYWNARREARNARLAATEREQMMKYYQIQTLQSQLQPHFIFNLLNAIKSFIVRGRQEEAEEHIERLSKVMRRFLESSVGAGLENLTQQGQEITLQSEIELLKYYIELMQVLKPGKFTFDIEVDPSVHPANVVIAPMIIQPFVENAIKHGLVPKKDSPGHLRLRFSRQEGGLLCTVQDNGPGFAMEPPTASAQRPGHKSMGIELVMNRVELLRNFGIQIDIQFESPPEGGARVNIYFAE